MSPRVGPRWLELQNLASPQGGYFTTAQAEECNISQPLLEYYIDREDVRRVFRGIFRFASFPIIQPFSPVLPYWLWAQKQCVFSHQTALALHKVTSAPSEVFFTLPPNVRKRAVLPEKAIVYRTEIPDDEQGTISAFSLCTTTILRAFRDCVDAIEADDRAATTVDVLDAAFQIARQREQIDTIEEREISAILDRIGWHKPSSKRR